MISFRICFKISFEKMWLKAGELWDDWTGWRVSAWHRAALLCREAPLLGSWPRPPEKCGTCCLVMTLPWVHDSQPQPGSVWVFCFVLFLVCEVEQDEKLGDGNMFHFQNLHLTARPGPDPKQADSSANCTDECVWVHACYLDFSAWLWSDDWAKWVAAGWREVRQCFIEASLNSYDETSLYSLTPFNYKSIQGTLNYINHIKARYKRSLEPNLDIHVSIGFSKMK